ncbi:unnamed protein product [Protopolystoma xenopodis]|uniref:Uncharacterized protein n=1 Tax=Protopolystoma xenopodis TaxID=117903 RepID=A0A3S5CFP1_9PLAT|nr:unnamed protein product [Protopolystoma xenopodis]
MIVCAPLTTTPDPILSGPHDFQVDSTEYLRQTHSNGSESALNLDIDVSTSIVSSFTLPASTQCSHDEPSQSSHPAVTNNITHDASRSANTTSAVDTIPREAVEAPTLQHTDWTRPLLRSLLCRAEFDIMPKLIFAESPTVACMLRTDVTRYMDFRFITRLLALRASEPPNEKEATEQASNINASFKCSTDPLVAHCLSTGSSQSPHRELIKIPLCRSDVFKTRLLSLRQKRQLGAFFEWCQGLEAAAIANLTSQEPVPSLGDDNDAESMISCRWIDRIEDPEFQGRS